MTRSRTTLAETLPGIYISYAPHSPNRTGSMPHQNHAVLADGRDIGLNFA